MKLNLSKIPPKIWLITFLAALSIYQSLPTFIYFFQPQEIRNDQEQFKQSLPAVLPDSHVKLGLDIQGGVQLVLGVDSKSAVDNFLAKMAVEIKRWSDENAKSQKKDPSVVSSYNIKDKQMVAILINTSVISVDEFAKEFDKNYPGFVEVSRKEGKIEYAYTEENIKRIRESSLEQAERVIRSRVDKWGVAEPLINRRQNGSILVQLPGFKDPKKAKELLGRTAQLQFKIVDDSFKGFSKITESDIPEGITLSDFSSASSKIFVSEDRNKLNEFLLPYIPEDRILSFEKEMLANKKFRWTTIVLNAATEITGSDIMDAFVVMAGAMPPQPAVNLKFSALGARRFAEVTGKNVGKRMAIVLDDVVESAPNIESKISGGDASITLGGNRNYDEIFEEANNLALILKSGSVPAKISVLEERQVGSTLGPELAKKGIFGVLLGLFSVLLFMLIYYKKPGFLSCLVLTFNGIMLLAAMAMFEFALTLPGIAGFILTLGMAVDANVLINERIRQELVGSKNAKKSIDLAFKKVFWTIIDANFTTLIACAILLATNSSGPIRGFAITLMIGLLISLFTSLFVTKLLINLIIQNKKDQVIRSWFNSKKAQAKGYKKWNISFLKFSKPVSILAIVICLATLTLTFVKGPNWGVDFAGGTEMVIDFSAPVEASKLRQLSQESGLTNVTIQSIGNQSKQYLVRYENDFSDKEQEGSVEITSSVQFVSFNQKLKDLTDNSFDILQVDFVGPQVGQELRVQGLLSIIYAIIGILLYIALRFDIRFGSGAIAKMIIDVLLVLGFYIFFQRTFDLTSVAAFLTVLGYSVNDTIVIYDRIRENILASSKKPLADIISISLNETFSRTLNTSFTTLIALCGILILSSGQLWTFAMAIAVGVVVATCSSLFIASGFLLAYEHFKKKNEKINSKKDLTNKELKKPKSSIKTSKA